MVDLETGRMKEMDKNRQRNDLRRIALLNPSADPTDVVEMLVRELDRFPDARIVAAYMALPGEVDLRELFGRIDKVWVFPRVKGDELKFYRVSDIDEDMKVGAFGILEPGDGLDEVAIGEVDVFLCPGLGFDRKGGRMGRGRGFYDRMLKQAKQDAVKIGVCFPFQIVDNILMEDHDVRMDLVIGKC